MELKPLASSNLAAAGYDAEAQTLTIEFHNGETYDYFNVPQGVYAGLMGAGSAGQYFARQIKGRFSYEQR